MPETVKMVAVFPVNSNGRGKADAFVTYETAREMVDARLATWSKGCKYLKLAKKTNEMFKTAPSLKPNVRIMDDYCEGKPYAVEIIESYKFKLAA